MSTLPNTFNVHEYQQGLNQHFTKVLNPSKANITLISLLTVCHTILTMLICRIYYCVN